MNYSVRGAISLEKNSTFEIEQATCKLLREIIAQNDIKIFDITQIIFSANLFQLVQACRVTE